MITEAQFKEYLENKVLEIQSEIEGYSAIQVESQRHTGAESTTTAFKMYHCSAGWSPEFLSIDTCVEWTRSELSRKIADKMKEAAA